MMNEDDARRLGLRATLACASRTPSARSTRWCDSPRCRPASRDVLSEANVLISRRIDPASATPAFKSAVVRLVPVVA
jgi:hypothetical protein